MNLKTSSIIQVVQLIVLIFILIYVGSIYHKLDKEGEGTPRIENNHKMENSIKMPMEKTELEKLQNLSTTKGRPGRVTVSEYAQSTGYHVDTIRAWIKRGELDAEMAGHRYLINLARNLPESGND